MSSTKSKLRLAGAFAALATLALAVGCRGFFVNPILSSLSIGPPTPTIETGTTNNTVQMHAVGTNNDGSTTSNPSVTWTVSGTASGGGEVATISTSGLVTSVAIGTATVTATSNQNTTITGTQTVTVTVGCVQSIALDKTSGSVTNNSPTFGPITATAQTCNGPSDVTQVATWKSSNASLATVSAGTVTIAPGLTTGGTVTITASIGNIVSNAATITVTP